MKNCIIRYFCWLSWTLLSQSSFAQTPTFYRDIQPLIHTNCAVCHRPGEAAPFSLITYEDVAKRSQFIRKVVTSRYMPPWRADDHYVTFANKRSLDSNQINLLTAWIEGGMPKGKVNTDAETALLKRTQAGTGYHRVPDLTLRMAKPFVVEGDGRERFMVFKIPFERSEMANIEAVEFSSNNKKVIHHANFAIHPVEDTTVSLTNTVDQVDLNGEEAFRYREWLPYKKELTYYGGWIPGTTVETYPTHMGWVLPKRGIMLLTVHFGPSAKDAETLNSVNFFFTQKPIRRTVKVISLGSGGIGEKEISPPLLVFGGDSLTTRLRVAYRNQPISLLYAWPHMHQIGKRFTAYITNAPQDTIPLVQIPDWDFRWQEVYRYPRPVVVPTGSIFHVVGTYDNTESNPMNPNKPPRLVTSDGQMRSDQEMLTLLLLYVTYEPGDENLKLD